MLEMTSYSQVVFFYSKLNILANVTKDTLPIEINKSFTSYIKNIEINSKILIQLHVLLFLYSFQCTSLK